MVFITESDECFMFRRWLEVCQYWQSWSHFSLCFSCAAKLFHKSNLIIVTDPLVYLAAVSSKETAAVFEIDNFPHGFVDYKKPLSENFYHHPGSADRASL